MNYVLILWLVTYSIPAPKSSELTTYSKTILLESKEDCYDTSNAVRKKLKESIKDPYKKIHLLCVKVEGSPNE